MTVSKNHRKISINVLIFLFKVPLYHAWKISRSRSGLKRSLIFDISSLNWSEVNVMKVCIYLLCYTIPKTGVFTDICTYCKLIKSTVFLNSSISNQMFMIVNSVNNSGIAGGMQSGRISSNNNCKSLTAERYTQFSVLVWDCSIT